MPPNIKKEPPAPVPNKSNELLKKIWAYVKTWGIGMKVIAILVVIGIIAEIIKRL